MKSPDRFGRNDAVPGSSGHHFFERWPRVAPSTKFFIVYIGRRNIFISCTVKLLPCHHLESETICVMDEYIVEDEDFQRKNSEWKPSEWISCGREYKDLPFYVSIEVQQARRMSAEIEATLPSPLYSPADFLHTSLPEWKESYDAWEEDDDLTAGTIAFDEHQPT